MAVPWLQIYPCETWVGAKTQERHCWKEEMLMLSYKKMVKREMTK